MCSREGHTEAGSVLVLTSLLLAASGVHKPYPTADSKDSSVTHTVS